ncbi:MAG: nucleotidyltransferase family protein [Armatimonadota bacterium]|nr:nucleotidyltransferase family protein [Armatimonadota bacterium]MDR7531969.1 nucleotidyltransferase family protein [Armatimonadota bacterium]
MDDLLLEIVRPSVRLAPARLEQLAHRTAWMPFCARAHRTMLAPLVYDRLRRFAAMLPRDVVEWLRHQYYFSVGRNLSLLHHLREINAQLARNGVSPLVLKGPGLAHFGMGVNLRLFGDVDILVRREELRAVGAVLRALGYEKPGSAGHPYHVPYVRSDGGLATVVEVHFDLVDRVRGITPDVDGVRARAVSVEVSGCAMRVPGVADQFLLTTMQLGHHHWAARLLVDVAFLAARWACTVDWAAMLLKADAWGMGALARSTLYVVSTLLGVSLPEQVARQVRPGGYARRVQWLVAMAAALEQFRSPGGGISWLAPYIVLDDVGRVPGLLVRRALFPNVYGPEGTGALSRGRRLLVVCSTLPELLKMLWIGVDRRSVMRAAVPAE